jgi:hypothetical protein
MRATLTQRQRILTAIIYLAMIWAVYAWLAANVQGAQAHAVFWFFSGALMIILGKYVVEPFFTTPADVIVNSLALLIALSSLSASDKQQLLGYRVFLYGGWTLLTLAIAAIAFKDAIRPATARVASISFRIAATFGASQVIFSALYLSTSYSFFASTGEIAIYVTTLALWICITFFDIVGIGIEAGTRLLKLARHGLDAEMGHAIGCENPLLYKVEVDHSKYKGPQVRYGDLVAIETRTNVGSIGMVVNRKQLLGKSWLSVYILTTPTGDVITLDLRGRKLIDDSRSVFTATNKVFGLDPALDLAEQDRTAVEATPLYAYKGTFVGYITRDSNINTISFIILRDRDATNREITEGVILKTTIYGESTLYQVINGNTREEHLAGFDSHGYTVGVARKLGKYDAVDYELVTRKWMPNIYAPLFFGFDGVVTPDRVAAIATSAIGRLPETDLEVRLKDIDSIVTHNTAILGILGIGKSCLAFELIKKVVAHGVKVVCIDITNQYNTPDGLHAYVGAGAISFDLAEEVRSTLKKSKDDPKRLIEGNPTNSGNADDYRKASEDDLATFFGSPSSVKIYNPDWHPASKGVAFKNTSLDDLTVAEKTRIVAERLFAYARGKGESQTARYLLVLEEAHSLVPEWNSVANEGDKSATNGTAKMILQGRKYGLGSLVITQRTANVSKSILNQCNTIFAMRVFDDTGKGFLENYIGSDYANTLPTLDERHAIAIGKGVRLKQPIILQLNDRAQFMVPSAAVAATPTATTLAGPDLAVGPAAADAAG